MQGFVSMDSKKYVLSVERKERQAEEYWFDLFEAAQKKHDSIIAEDETDEIMAEVIEEVTDGKREIVCGFAIA